MNNLSKETKEYLSNHLASMKASSKFSWVDILTSEVFQIVLPIEAQMWNLAEKNQDFNEWARGRIIKRRYPDIDHYNQFLD